MIVNYENIINKETYKGKIKNSKRRILNIF